MKFDIDFLAGVVSLLVFCVCGILSASGGLGTILLCILLFFAAAAAIVAVYAAVLPVILHVKNLRPDWIVIAPFAVMLLLSRIFLGWNVFVPFVVAAFLLLTYDTVKKQETLSVTQTLTLVGVGALSASLLILASMAGGVLL